METGYNVFLHEFREIVELIESVDCYRFSASDTRLEYRFDGGFLPPLFLVATKCRDRVVRRRAIKLLKARPMREGVFDSVCVGHMSEWIVTLEEGLEAFEEEASSLPGRKAAPISKGDPGEDEVSNQSKEIPDWRRLRIRRSNIDLMGRRAQLQGTVFKHADDEEPVWKEVVLRW